MQEESNGTDARTQHDPLLAHTTAVARSQTARTLIRIIVTGG